MMQQFRLVDLPQTESTNTYARTMPVEPSDTTPIVVTTDCQTCGRGQRGNSWESEPSKNLTFTLVVYPRWMSPARQFELSMLVSVGIVAALRPLVPEPEALTVKWPNDIYYGDKKLAGILIENSIGAASIERSLIGIGLNVNQTVFRSDAPNPVSLALIADHEFNRMEVLDDVVDNILDAINMYADDPEPDELAALYDSMLWRNDGQLHRWRDMATGRVFEARMTGVDIDGKLHLTESDGAEHEYLFKEVMAVL